MEFEWDPAKAEVNERKHGITFLEAATIFGNPLAITFVDPDHSVDEHDTLPLGFLGLTGCSSFPILIVKVGLELSVRGL